MIDQQMEAEGRGEQTEMGEEGGAGGSRLGTLLPLITCPDAAHRYSPSSSSAEITFATLQRV